MNKKPNPFVWPGIERSPASFRGNVNLIWQVISQMFNLTKENIRSSSRSYTNEVMLARHFIHRFLYRRTGMTSIQVAQMTNRTHGSVLHSCKLIDNWISTKDPFLDKYKKFEVEMFKKHPY